MESNIAEGSWTLNDSILVTVHVGYNRFNRLSKKDQTKEELNLVLSQIYKKEF